MIRGRIETKKKARSLRFGPNPPLEEVEETIITFAGYREHGSKFNGSFAALQ